MAIGSKSSGRSVRWVVAVMALLGGLAAGRALLRTKAPAERREPHAGESSALSWHYTLKPQSSSLGELDEVLGNAKLAGKPVMIDFYADWCGVCKELERLTYAAPPVAAELQRFVRIKVDSTDQTELIDQVQKRFGVQGLPTLVFFSSQGQPLPERTVLGFVPAEPFLGELKKIP